MRKILGMVGAALVALTWATSPAVGQQKPNIIMIMGDDASPSRFDHPKPERKQQ
jgi:hypothetical protein